MNFKFNTDFRLSYRYKYNNCNWHLSSKRMILITGTGHWRQLKELQYGMKLRQGPHMHSNSHSGQMNWILEGAEVKRTVEIEEERSKKEQV